MLVVIMLSVVVARVMAPSPHRSAMNKVKREANSLFELCQRMKLEKMFGARRCRDLWHIAIQLNVT